MVIIRLNLEKRTVTYLKVDKIMDPIKQFPPSSAPPPYHDITLINPQIQHPTSFNTIERTSYQSSSNDRMSKFQDIVNRYEINRDFATRLRHLEGYEIVFIVDDSGSMNAPLDITFVVPPAGPTPIVPILRQVLRDKQAEIQERKLLILIAT
ncbi:unnamed protein product, partial [Didymodactylos carnosus]